MGLLPLTQNGKCVDQFKWNLFCTVYVSFKYEWTKTTNKNHKNYISTLFYIDCSVICIVDHESWCSLSCETLKHVGLQKFKTWSLKNEQKCASGLKCAHTLSSSAELFLRSTLKVLKKWTIFDLSTSHGGCWRRNVLVTISASLVTNILFYIKVGHQYSTGLFLTGDEDEARPTSIFEVVHWNPAASKDSKIVRRGRRICDWICDF